MNYEKKGRIAYVTINRPERLNALHPPANQELLDVFTDFKNDDDSWIAIITGTGDRSFSAGNDLRYTAENFEEALEKVAPSVTEDTVKYYEELGKKLRARSRRSKKRSEADLYM